MSVLWSEEMATGDAELDSQHKEMLAYVAQVWDAFEAGAIRTIDGVLERVVAHVAEHFALEEQFMSSRGFPGVESHRRSHQVFIAHLESFGAGSPHPGDEPLRVARLVSFLQEWARDHIAGQDRSFAVFLRARPAAG